MDSLDSCGANQVRLPSLRHPKLEGRISRGSLGGGNVAAAALTNCKSYEQNWSCLFETICSCLKHGTLLFGDLQENMSTSR